MSPRSRMAGRALVATGLAFIDLVAAVYLILIPRAALEMSPTWAGALRWVPLSDPRLLGVGFLIAGICVAATALDRHVRVTEVVGYALAAATWGLLMGSFIYAAFQPPEGLGALGAGFATLAAFAHLGWILTRR